jgi:hypothetical protein
MYNIYLQNTYIILLLFFRIDVNMYVIPERGHNHEYKIDANLG